MDHPFNSKITWFKQFQISEQPVAYMPYQQFKVTIFKSSDQSSLKNHFFYTPISLLNSESTFSRFDRISQNAEVHFQVEFWSKDIESCVVCYLQRVYKIDVIAFNVHLIPFDQVLLCSETYSKNYQVISRWTPYQLKTSMWFSILCASVTDADDLAEDIQQKPEHCSLLKSLRIKFGFSALEQLHTKEILIHRENIRSSHVFQKINQEFPLANSVLLTAEDFSNLLSESVGEVINSNFNVNEILVATSTASILSKIELMLCVKKMKTDNDPSLWNSVFWLNENLRPDRAAEFINELYNELDEEAQDRLKDFFLSRSDFSFDNWTQEKNLLKTLKSNRRAIEWDGYQFVPKSTILYSINISSIPSKYTRGNVLTHFTSAALSMAINVQDSTTELILLKGNISYQNTKSKLEVILAHHIYYRYISGRN